MAETSIDGWRCEAIGDYREATRGRVRVSCDDTGLEWHEEHLGYSGASGSGGVPQSVMSWLIRPLLHKAWEDGAMTALRQALRQGPLPDLRNPYEGPTNG